MKTINFKYLALWIVLFYSSFMFASLKWNDTLVCLKISGSMVSDTKNGEYHLELFQNNVKVDSVILHRKSRNFHFYLDRNAIYTLKISKAGFKTKLICFDTSIPEYFGYIHTYDFKVQLYKDSDTKHNETIRHYYPVALIYFNNKKKEFNYSRVYKKSSIKNVQFNEDQLSKL